MQDGDRGSGTENGLEGGYSSNLVEIGGTGVGGGGRCTRGWVDAMLAAELFALRGGKGS